MHHSSMQQEAWSKRLGRRLQEASRRPTILTMQRRVLVVLLLAAVALHTAAHAQAPANSTNAAVATAQSDVTAIMSVWGSLSPYEEDSILQAWAGADPDPCVAGWPGVICRCGDLPNKGLAAACEDALASPSSSTSSSTVLRVLGLDLGPITTAGSRKLEGRLDPALGNLDQLIYLDLSNNDLTGPLPETLSKLTKLQFLLLDGNQLSGSLPAFLGQLPDLKQVQLQNNNFSGSVPPSWCSGSTVYDVAGNRHLCGMLPNCFYGTNRMGDDANTYLSDGLSGSGGACDSTPPDCDVNVGCVIWTPLYWTSRSMVNFNFTGFMDYESGITRYEWGIGSKSGQADVVPLMPVTAARVLKDIKFSGGTQKMFVTPVVYNLTSISLLDGHTYFVTVVAWNGAGPSLSINASSFAVVVDTSGPVAGAASNTGYIFQQASTTTSTDTLQASWDNFTDPQSYVSGYVVQFFQQTTNPVNGSITLKPLSEPIAVKNNTNRLQVKSNDTLPEGMQYVAKVTALNGAGLTSTTQTPPTTVTQAGDGTIPTWIAAVIIVLCGIACLVVGAWLAWFGLTHANERQRELDKRKAEENKQLKAMLLALSSHRDVHGGSVSLPQPHRVGEVSEEEVAFVQTDIQSSTELSQQNPKAFKTIQIIHDQLMREAIARQAGYEISTEGDSFLIAFNTCHAAMSFCLDIQGRLLEQSWDKDVLSLSACKVVKDPLTGMTLFAGPRVRMGLHWARRGEVVVRVHHLTRHKVFAGPALLHCQEMSDCANGGQILVTEEAVMQLSEDMSRAGFPVIKLLGMFQLVSSPSAITLYGVTDMLGQDLPRQFAGLRKTIQMWPDPPAQLPAVLEYSIMPPPVPDHASNNLVFVVLRLAYDKKDDKTAVPAPKALAAKLEEVYGICAQQFRGYMFRMHSFGFSYKEGYWAVAFQQSMDALRFTHATQMLLVQADWPADAKDYFGEVVRAPDGRLLFRGPRVCMAIHESPDFFAYEDSTLQPKPPRTAMSFDGPAMDLPKQLAKIGRGGQIILSELAWDSVKQGIMQHPGAATVKSLGMHVVSDDFPKPMLLMEVMPTLLTGRNFKPLGSQRRIEPGFRDAPDPMKPMAIVFVKIHKPQEVLEAEKGSAGGALDDQDAVDQITLTLQAYQLGVSKYTSVARKLLRRYDGYECKEPEPGKFTLAFKDLSAAIRWGCHVQEEILYLDWPEELLQWKDCDSEYDQEGNLIWRGFRLKIGIAWGLVSTQKPLNTGRADYFGVLANGAARVMALATPGQVLVMVEEKHPALNQIGQPLLQPDATTALELAYTPGTHLHHKHHESPAPDPATTTAAGEDQLGSRLVLVAGVGRYDLRGVGARELYSAKTCRLQHRALMIEDKMLSAPLNSSFSPGSSGNSLAFMRASFQRFNNKRTSPRNSSTSPTGNVEGFGSMSLPRKKGSQLFRHYTPSATFGSGDSLVRAGAQGSTTSTVEGPYGPVRTLSSLRAVSQQGPSFSRESLGALSDAGRRHSSALRLLQQQQQQQQGDSSLAASAGSYSSSVMGAGGSLHNLLSSSQSESAAAGRGVASAEQLPTMLQRGGAGAGTVIIDAAGPSEDESGGTPATASAAQGAAAWPDHSGDAAATADPLQCIRGDSSSSFTSVRAPAAIGDVFEAAPAAGDPAACASGSPSATPQVHGHEMTDPLLGCVSIPAINTAVAPESASWCEGSSSTPASGAHSNSSSTALAAGAAGSSEAAAAFSSDSIGGGSLKPGPQQQPHQQLQQVQRQRSLQLLSRSISSSGGGSGGVLPPSTDPNAVPTTGGMQQWQQQPTGTWDETQQQPWQTMQQDGLLVLGGSSSANGAEAGRPCSSPVSLSTTMTSCIDVDDLSGSGQAQQQEAGMPHLTSEGSGSEASLSFNGAGAGMKKLLSGKATNMHHRLSGGSGGGAPQRSAFARLLGKAGMRRHSTSSIPLTGFTLHGLHLHRQSADHACYDEDSVDREVEQQQQSGMAPRVSMHSSLSYTPGSSAAGSRAGTGGGAEQPMQSPGAQFAAHLAQAYVQARRSSNASLQTLAQSQGGQDNASFNGVCGGPQSAGSSHTQHPSGLGGMLPDSSAGRLGGSFVARSSASKDYTYYAESSYSPKHCRPHANPVANWQQEHSVAGGAAAGAVGSDEIAVQLQQQQQPQAAAGKLSQQEATAAQLSSSMWASTDGRQQPAAVRSTDPLAQQLERHLLQHAQLPDSQQSYVIGGAMVPSRAGSPELQQTRQDLQRSSQSLHDAVQDGVKNKLREGVQAWLPDSYREKAQQMRGLRSDTSLVYLPGVEHDPMRAVRKQDRAYVRGVLAQQQPPGRQEQDRLQQHEQQQAAAQPVSPTTQQQHQQCATAAHQQPLVQQPPPVQHQQQQSVHDSRMHAQQPAPSCRPSPLGKNAKSSGGAAVPGSTVRAVASSSHAMPTASGRVSTSSLGAAWSDGRNSPSPTTAAAAVKRAAAVLQAGVAAASPCASFPPSNSRGSSAPNSPRFGSAPSSIQGLPLKTLSLQSLGGSSGQGSPRSSLPTTPRSFSQRGALGGASFGSASGAGGPAFLSALQRVGSSSSAGSPKPGMMAPAGLYAASGWPVARGSPCGDGADSEDADDDCEYGGPAGSSYLPATCPAGVRARTPSCTVAGGQKDALIPIPEVAGLEGRLSDPNTDKP